MPVRPIESPEDRAIAVELLTQGFPAKPAAIWTAFFERLQMLGTNVQTGVPLGYLLPGADGDTGVMITPASYRARPDGTDGLVVNLSSWYVAASDRWRGGRMLQAVLKRHEAMFTDLTPTPEVQAMLPAFGFKSINSGIVITLLPVAAAQPAGGFSVGTLDQSEAALSKPVAHMLKAHQAVGCLAGTLDAGGNAVPLLFRRRVLKGVPAAKLIYCPDMARFQEALPAVARFLIKHGIGLLLSDDTGAPIRSGQMRRQRGIKFVKPGAGLAHDPKATDHTASELALLDL